MRRGSLVLVPVVWCLWSSSSYIFGTVAAPWPTALLASAFGRILGFGCPAVCVELYQRSRTCPFAARPTRRATVLSFALEVCSATGFILYAAAAQRDGNVALTSSVVSLHVLVPVAVGWCVLGDRLGREQLQALASACAGVCCLSLSGSRSGESGGGSNLDGMTALLVAGVFVFWGAAYSLGAAAHRVADMPALLSSFTAGALANSLLALVVAAFATHGSMLPSAHTSSFLVMGASQITTGIGVALFSYISAELGPIIAPPLCSGYNVVTVVAGVTLQNNTLDAFGYVGVLLALLSVALVARQPEDSHMNVATSKSRKLLKTTIMRVRPAAETTTLAGASAMLVLPLPQTSTIIHTSQNMHVPIQD